MVNVTHSLERFIRSLFYKDESLHIVSFHPTNNRSYIAIHIGMSNALSEEKSLKLWYGCKSAQGTSESIYQAARELVARKNLSVIATYGDTCSLAVKAALEDRKKVIPLVFIGVSDPVRLNLVNSLHYPGAHITGVQSFEFKYAERMDHLFHLIPTPKRAVVFSQSFESYSPDVLHKASMLRAFYERGISVYEISLHPHKDMESVIRNALQEIMPDVVIAMNEPIVLKAVDTIVGAAMHFRIPVYAFDEGSVRAGAAFGCGHVGSTLGALVAQPIRAIIGGQEPANLPVIQYKDRYKVFVNIMTARAQGLDLSPEAVQWVQEHGMFV